LVGEHSNLVGKVVVHVDKITIFGSKDVELVGLLGNKSVKSCVFVGKDDVVVGQVISVESKRVVLVGEHVVLVGDLSLISNSLRLGKSVRVVIGV
jgi:hypothetical protein